MKKSRRFSSGMSTRDIAASWSREMIMAPKSAELSSPILPF